MKNISFTLLTISFFGIVLGSCKSNAKLPDTSITITGRLALKKLQPPEGKALVYIFRNQSMGMIKSLILDIDHKNIGETKGKQFLYTFIDPGKHLIVSRGENVSELPIKLDAGQTYYIQQKPKMGLFSVRSKLIRLEEEEGKRYLSYCRLSKSNITFEGF